MSEATSFWSWVTRHEAALRAVIGPDMTGDEPVLDELLAALHAYDPGLYYLMGVGANQQIELIISAEGDIERFGAVRALVAAAPAITGWRVIAFKPAMGFGFVVTHDRARIDTATAWFQALSSPTGQFAVRLACADYVADADEDFVYAAEMLLAGGLGELAARDIHHVTVVALPAAPAEEGFLPLAELAGYMAFRASQLPS